jgi:hypothetical protein
MNIEDQKLNAEKGDAIISKLDICSTNLVN